MCNVVVSGSQPYPENADYYVQSVQGWKKERYSSSSNKTICTFVNSNNEKIYVLPIYKTGEGYTLQIINYDTKEILEERILSISSEKYVIGSLNDKSYMVIDAPTYQSGGSTAKSKYIMYYDNHSNSDGYPGIIVRESSSSCYMFTFIYEPDIPRTYYGTQYVSAINQLIYNRPKISDMTLPASERFIYYDYMYDDNGNKINYSDLGIPNENCLIKINIIKNNVKICEDYYWLAREVTDAMMKQKQSKLKLQNPDGTYFYINAAGELIAPEDFPSGEEVAYEFTLNTTNV